MEKKQALIWQVELLWWAITAVIMMAIFIPIYRAMNEWPFWGWNAAFIVVLMTYIRHIFLLDYTFVGRHQYIKAALIIVLFPLTFIMVNGLNAFMSFIEENDWTPLTGHLPVVDRSGIESFIWTQMLFFGAGSVVSAPILAVRLFVSIWRQHNQPRRKTVLDQDKDRI